MRISKGRDIQLFARNAQPVTGPGGGGLSIRSRLARMLVSEN